MSRRASTARRAVLASLALPALLAIAAGCQRSRPEQSAPAPAQSAQVSPGALPPLELTPTTTKSLYLTYLKEDGDFEIVERIADVPEASREAVRVVEAGNEAGTGELVYVADLRQPGPGGTYPVEIVSRTQWDAKGAERRKVRLEQMVPSPSAQPAASAGPDPANAKVRAIVYGADWCKPCHLAEDYLKGLGVNVTKKDIEKSDAARAEMQQKLAKIGKQGAGIPVIDIAGQLLLGFNERAVKHAVVSARSTPPR